MERVAIEEIDNVVDSATVKRPLTNALHTSHLAINYYELEPGDSFAYGYHMHDNQEEVIIVQSGTATFETEDGDVSVKEGEIIRFAPGEYQRGENRSSERVEAIALGAPQEAGVTEILRYCKDCGKRTPQTVEWIDNRTAKQTRCEDCEKITERFERSTTE